MGKNAQICKRKANFHNGLALCRVGMRTLLPKCALCLKNAHFATGMRTLPQECALCNENAHFTTRKRTLLPECALRNWWSSQQCFWGDLTEMLLISHCHKVKPRSCRQCSLDSKALLSKTLSYLLANLQKSPQSSAVHWYATTISFEDVFDRHDL